MSIFGKKQEDEKVERQEMTQDQNQGQTTNEAKIYNLIILDESGSMSCVTHQTISGCNETLAGIRSTAKDLPDQRQYVSIYCFDTSNPRYLFKNVPIEEVRDLTDRDYQPNACTPLYDAIGFTVTELKSIANNLDAVGKVTIITDGYENASQKWNHSSVVELIESLKKQGWLFTFMGANIDVERTSRSLGINSFMEFKQTDEGMHDMFICENRSQRAHAEKMSFLRKSAFYRKASDADRMMMFMQTNENYFTEDERVAPNHIHSLSPNQIFVFGSNSAGDHNGSAAGLAVARFGAIMGQAEGLQGQSYAIPTFDVSFEELRAAIERFTEFAVRNPKYNFMLTAIGCGNAGYTPAEIAPLFKQAYKFGNVYVPASFLPFVQD